MPHDFFDRTPDQQVLVFIEHVATRSTEGFIKSCEQRNPYGAAWPFNVVLDHITGFDPKITDYILERPGMVSELQERDRRKGSSLGVAY